MDENVGWLGRIVQYFGPMVAAWTAALAFIVHLKKVRNAEKAAEHSRLLDEIDRLISERDVKTEECDMVRDKLADAMQRIAELQGRAVKAEATLEGIGEARQEAQRIVSAERQKDRRGNGGADG